MNIELKNLILNILETKENVIFNIVFELKQQYLEFDSEEEDYYCILDGTGKFYYGSESNLRIKFTQEAYEVLLETSPSAKEEFQVIDQIARKNWENSQLGGFYSVFGYFESDLVHNNLVFVLMYEIERENYQCISILTHQDFFEMLGPNLNLLIDRFDLQLIRFN